MRNVWSILCREVLTDQETNSVSYFHCIEEGIATILPTMIHPVTIGTLWEKTADVEEIFAARVVFKTPSGGEKRLIETKPFAITNLRQRLHFKIDALSIVEYGRHEFLVEFLANGEWRMASCLPFLIKQPQNS